MLQRSILMFLIGLSLNTVSTGPQLETIRIFGVLQRFGITYFIVALIYLCLMTRKPKKTQVSGFRNNFFVKIKDMIHILNLLYLPVSNVKRSARFSSASSSMVCNVGDCGYSLFHHILSESSRMSHVCTYNSMNYIHLFTKILNYFYLLVVTLVLVVFTMTQNILIAWVEQRVTSTEWYSKNLICIIQPRFINLDLMILKEFWVYYYYFFSIK